MNKKKKKISHRVRKARKPTASCLNRRLLRNALDGDKITKYDRGVKVESHLICWQLQQRGPESPMITSAVPASAEASCGSVWAPDSSSSSSSWASSESTWSAFCGRSLLASTRRSYPLLTRVHRVGPNLRLPNTQIIRQSRPLPHEVAYFRSSSENGLPLPNQQLRSSRNFRQSPQPLAYAMWNLPGRTELAL